MEIIFSILHEIWKIILEAAPYLFWGFLVSGFIHMFLNSDNIFRFLQKGKYWSVFLISLLGVPLPLCSCGVIPAAVTLKKQGVNKGAVSSFLISTPETGVPSIAMTYALMGYFMAIIRPVAAFITALAAGSLVNIFDKDKEANKQRIDKTCPIDACCDGKDCPPEKHRKHHTNFERLKAGLRFAFVDLISDISLWMMFGFVLAGIISYLIPENLISSYLDSSLSSKLVVLLAGIPMYICASASTPMMAALMLKGMSPGTALVFLMAGPATNIASITVILGILGKKATAIYIASIAFFALAFGILVDYLYEVMNVSNIVTVKEHLGSHGTLSFLSGALLLGLMSFYILKKHVYSFFKKSKVSSCCNRENLNRSCCSKDGHHE